MTFRLITKNLCITTGMKANDNLKLGNDFKFNISLKQLALDSTLLKLLNFISLRNATNEDKIKGFRFYLDSFLRNKPSLSTDDNLLILVSDEDIQKKLIEYLVK